MTIFLLNLFIWWSTPYGHASNPVQIGSKAFSESVILGYITEYALETKGYTVNHHIALGGSRVLWEALQKRAIDVYPEYTGTLRYEILHGISRKELQEVLHIHGMGMTKSLGFHNGYALAMRKDKAKTLHIERISDLMQHPDLTYGITAEWMERKDGFKSLQQYYGFSLERQPLLMEHPIALQAIQSGKIDVTDVYTTDPEVDLFQLTLLQDDRHFFPPYEAVLLYRLSLAQPVIDTLHSLENTISTPQMRQMNLAVKNKSSTEKEVAVAFVQKHFQWAHHIDFLPQWQQFMRYLQQHLLLVIVPSAMATLVGVTLGFLGMRHKRLGLLFLGVSTSLQTIPSLALLVLFVPLFGIGQRPALVALFFYGLLPILRSSLLGFSRIDAGYKDAARSLGANPWQLFCKIELWLAMPAILSGLRTTFVINTGTATLGAFIGAGGLGVPIMQGLRLNDHVLVIKGALLAIGLAFTIEGFFYLLTRTVLPKPLR